MSSVTCIAWPSNHPKEVAFGLLEGRVRVGALKDNKSATLYGTDNASPVTAIVSCIDGRGVLAAHLDGSIYRFVLSADGSSVGIPVGHSKFAHHSCPPSALAVGSSVLAVGSDGRASFYGLDGSLVRTFDYSAGASADGRGRDLTVAAFSPSGEAAAVGTFDGFFLYALSAAEKGGGSNTRAWTEVIRRDVPSFFSTTAVAWKPDGSKFLVGGLTGAADLYDACLRRTRYRGRFEFTFVSHSTVIVKRLSSGMRIVLRSSFGYEIGRIRIHADRYLTARTPATLLMGDLDSCRLSEIPWSWEGGGAGVGGSRGGKNATLSAAAVSTERFLFDVWPSVCIVERGGALTLVEYGTTEPLGCFRTEHMSLKTLSVRVHVPAGGGAGGSPIAARKTLAYLLDSNTLVVSDLSAPTGPVTLATVSYPESKS